MIRLLPLLPLLLLAACTTAPPVKHPSKPPIATNQAAAIATKPCELLDRDLLKPAVKAEGTIASAANVATERGKQVDELNWRLRSIEEVLDGGCIK